MRVFLLLSLIALGAGSPSKSVHSKIGPSLLHSLNKDPQAKENIVVSFNGIKAALSEAQLSAQNVADRGARNAQIHNALVANAQNAQSEAKALLQSFGVLEQRMKSFWITNHLFVKSADKALIESLAQLPSVSAIDLEPVGQLQRPIIEDGPSRRRDLGTLAAEWNIEKMRSHLVWEQPWGNNGTGVVVGFIDTGARGTHEAIRDQYLNDGKSWRDPYDQYYVPTDVYNHGTHTIGSVVGK